ncbi:MAG: nucleotide pyrophosphohydrolase [Zoogloeaceae bacterium]|nr:nucleotide pyrophosphohydrolase [Zoogloeaceae bacterium]
MKIPAHPPEGPTQAAGHGAIHAHDRATHPSGERPPPKPDDPPREKNEAHPRDTAAADSLQDLTQAVLAFRDARDWAQFHGIKHLMVSLCLEAGEVLELSQWKSDAEVETLPQDAASREALADECADVLAYLLLLADRAGIDLATALKHKLIKNAQKYPIAKSRGRREKYSALVAEETKETPHP